MHQTGRLLIGFLVLFFLLFISCEKATSPDSQVVVPETVISQNTPQAGTPIEGSYIVVLKQDQFKFMKNASPEATADFVKQNSLEILETAEVKTTSLKKVYSTVLKGFHANISANEAEKLQNDKLVDYIEQDMVIYGGPPWAVPDDPVAQTIPWGITRVGGGATYTGSQVAWVIDSGIDLDHPDLNVDVSRSVTFVDRTTTGDDDNGHGTHVAGTIAAIDNDIQVVGVAAGATVVAVKVLDKRGSGSTTGVIAGIDYVAANAAPGDVANMSLGGGVSDALDLAVFNASENGIYFALAAGNESDDANNHSPARVNGDFIYTVSAFDINDVWASFSNYSNPPVDYSGPGVDILSLYKNGGTATMNGTSMATPHIAGLLLINGANISTDGYVINDPDGNADPIAHN